MNTGTIDNKFKFIAIAAARCHQLQRGARPRVDTRSHKPVTIAQEEVRAGLVEYRVPDLVNEGPAAAAVDAVSQSEHAG